MKTILVSLLMFLATCSFAQKDTVKPQSKVFKIVEQMPAFPQGEDSLRRFIDNHIHYPDMESGEGVIGRIVVRVVVRADGSLTDAEVIKNLNPAMDKEALRVISTLPKFTPGKQQGTAVDVEYVIPIKSWPPYIVKVQDIKDAPVSDNGKAVTNPDRPRSEPVISSAPIVEDPIYEVVEQMPIYPAGDKAMMEFIKKNIMYPAMEKENDIQGRVMIGIVVERDGSLSDIHIRRGVSQGLDKEAIRVVKLLGKFNPGKQQGKAVRVKLLIPVIFTLPDTAPSR